MHADVTAILDLYEMHSDKMRKVWPPSFICRVAIATEPLAGEQIGSTIHLALSVVYGIFRYGDPTFQADTADD